MHSTKAIKAFLYVFILLLSITSLQLSAQVATEEQTVLYRIETKDGNEYIGEILEENEDFILLNTERLGQITINRRDIKSITQVDSSKKVGEEFWLDNPQATRYFWSPNGYGLKKGEGYYQNVWVLFNQASYGITDNISIGVGTVPLFLFGSPVTPVWITPKVSVPVVEDKFNIGAGALVGSAIGLEGASFGLLYGMGTLGSRDRNLTMGLGYGFGGGEISSTPIFTISGMYRTGKKGYILGESYFASADGAGGGIIMLGGRRIFQSVGLDYGGIIPVASGAEGFYVIPWLGITLPFGNKGK